MNFALVKAKARRGVHAALAVPCFYYDVDTYGFNRQFNRWFSGRMPITARFHDRISPFQAPTTGYAAIIEGITRVVLNREQLAALGVVTKQYDIIEFVDYGLFVKLQQRDPYDGPITEKWTVSPR